MTLEVVPRRFPRLHPRPPFRRRFYGGGWPAPYYYTEPTVIEVERSDVGLPPAVVAKMRRDAGWKLKRGGDPFNPNDYAPPR